MKSFKEISRDPFVELPEELAGSFPSSSVAIVSYP
jgi:hypothetical protein